jgi:AcrR family transcriptional regulator
MTEGKRVYRSPLREEQARRTRAAVLDAAGACFLESGYAATTMRDVATRAEVSVQTVFGQGSKASLLLACVDRAVVGDDEAVAFAEREPFVRFVTAPDLDDKLDALREITRRHVPQTLPMIWAFADAAAGDPEIAQAWAEYEQRRRTDVRALVGALEPWLRSDLDVERATDIYWAFFSDAPARSLIRGLGWTVEQIADLLTDALRRLLLQ